MDDVTLFSDRGIIVDTAITSIVASLLVTLFTTSGVHRDVKAGRLVIPPGTADGSSIFHRLPRNAWGLGLTLGVGIALLLTALTLALFAYLSVETLPALWFLVSKGVYTGLLGMFVARSVILRQLMADRSGPEPGG